MLNREDDKQKTHWPQSKAKAALSGLTALLALATTGCMLDSQNGPDGLDESATRTVGQEVLGGEAYPSLMNGGTVYLKTWGPTGVENKCTAQVISRDTVLTSAHCFYDVGYFDDGWDDKKSVRVCLFHQDPDTTWDYLTACAETVDLYVQEDYFDARQNGDKKRIGLDIAVVQRHSDLSYIVQKT